MTVFDVEFSPDDEARTEITGAGAGGAGLIVTWRF